MTGWSRKQAQVLTCIQAWMRRTGQAPSSREIAAHRRVTGRAASPHVRALERQGVLATARRPRGMRLSPEHVLPAGLPIIGRVAAGTPGLAVEHVEGSLEIDRLGEDRSHLFVLRVKGDRLVDRQIVEGDDVIVRAQPWGEQGDIGVVVIAEEVTVKTILHQRTGLWLQSENRPQGSPVIRPRPDQGVRIVGQLLAVLRPLSPEAFSDQLSAVS